MADHMDLPSESPPVGGGGVGGGLVSPQTTRNRANSIRARSGSNLEDAEENAENVERLMSKTALEHPFMAHDEMIKKFVITGGPCSGKTTAMGRLTEFLQDKGFRVFVAIEAATVLWRNGVSPVDLGKPECEEAFQQFVLNFQMTVEDNMFKFAKATGVKSIILCDRGLMDGSAYVTPKQWENVLEKCKVPTVTTSDDGTQKVDMVSLNLVSARDQRYDAVFHLVTAADGAPQYYTLENNLGARHETPDMARQQDMRTQKAWSGHPHHRIIDNNNKNFEQKMEELVALLSKYVGLPVLMRKSRKYHLKEDVAIPQWVDDVNGGQWKILGNPEGNQDINDVHIFEIEKIILNAEKFKKSFAVTSNSMSRSSSLQRVSNPDDNESTPPSLPLSSAIPSKSGEDGEVVKVFIRKRSQNGLHSFGLTTVKRLPNTGEEIELKDVINEKYYKLLQNLRDTERNKIRERRLHFIYNKQSFVIHEINYPQQSRYLECQANQNDPDLPPCLHVDPEDEILDDKSYSYRISKNPSALNAVSLEACYFSQGEWPLIIHDESKIGSLIITEADLKHFRSILASGMLARYKETMPYSSQSPLFMKYIVKLSNAVVVQFGSYLNYDFKIQSESIDDLSMFASVQADQQEAAMVRVLNERSFKLFLDFYDFNESAF